MSTQNQNSDFDQYRKYYTGAMSKVEKIAFEKDLEKDPFAQEAYEGFLLLENDFKRISAIENTNMALKKKLGLEETIQFPLKTSLAIAASLCLLFVTYFFVKSTFNEQKNAIAENHQINQEEKPIQIEEMIAEEQIMDSFSDSINIEEDVLIEVEAQEIEMDEEAGEIAKPKAPQDNNYSFTVDEPKQITQKDYEHFYSQQNDVQNEIVTEEEVIEIKANQNKSLKQNGNLKAPVKEPSSFNSGIVAYNKSQYNSAIKYFNNSIKISSNITSSNYYIGMSYFNLNKPNKAIQYYDKVIGSSSSFADDALWYKSLSLINKGQKSKAKIELSKLIEMDSGFKALAQKKLNSL